MQGNDQSTRPARPNTSRMNGFRSDTPDVRRQRLGQATGVNSNLFAGGALPLSTADGMIENVVGLFELPLSVATNFKINGRDYLIPMVLEEPSVVAAASYMARIAREAGGFQASADAPVMRGQIQVLGVTGLSTAKQAVLDQKAKIIAAANACDSMLVDLGGGCIDIEAHEFPETAIGPMLVIHLLVDVRDAMGANAVNTMAEAVSPMIERLTDGRARLRILSNLADRRLARASVRLPFETLTTAELSGKDVAEGIVEACAFAEVDPYRAATHNKGIMNGIDPVVVATGNDWRAIEAGAHAFAARSGHYTALTRWRIVEQELHGQIELPMALGLVGGATKTHPAAQAALKLMGVTAAQELAGIVATVGLAQNMAALRALATEGIQRGHMRLHARNIAIQAGAEGDDIDRIATALAENGEITVAAAQRLLSQT
ncbi:MAG: hydroxymethylglutaryl-CoA reductase, degradative [Pikeienuella sp.]